MSNKGSFKWRIDGQLLQKMLKSNVGQKYQSEVFEIAKLKWRINCYPNGNNQTTKGSFMVFLRLIEMPDNMSSITLLRTIKCIETEASFTDIATYNADNKSGGWPSRYQLLSELVSANFQSITIRTDEKIIKIVDNNHDTMYFNHEDNKQIVKMLKHTLNIEWKINQETLTKFKSAEWGKKFASTIDQDDLFRIECKPKGSRKEHEGWCGLYLGLNGFPFLEAAHIELRYTLTCTNNRETCTYTNTFNKNNSSWGENKFCRFNDLFVWSGQSSLTFTAEIKIIIISDDKQQIIPKWNWNDNNISLRKYSDCFKISPSKQQQQIQSQDEAKEEKKEYAPTTNNDGNNENYDSDIISQLVSLGIGKRDECIKASQSIVDYKNPNAVVEKVLAIKKKQSSRQHGPLETTEEKVRERTKKGQMNFMGELEELIQIIQKHINFMTEQENKVNELIQKSDKPQLLFDAKKVALKTEKNLMLQIMNISTMNSFLTNIILVENLFNQSYNTSQRQLQQTARKKYDQNIQIYEEKPKPLSKSGSFIDLLFGAKTAFTSFKQFIKSIQSECTQNGIKMQSNSGAKEKNIERAFYKSYYVYGAIYGDRGHEQMTDVLRCSIVFDNFDDLYKCYSIIENLTKSNGSGGILRVKDRFNPKDIEFGYRDLLINIKCKGSDIICEVQLHHELFYKHKAISHIMYKKARLFEVKDENLAYLYANKNLRPEIGDKVYEVEDEIKEETNDPWILLKQWKLEQYGEMLIDDEGYDDVELWKDISEQELRNMEWENENGKKIKWKNGHIKKFIKNSAQL